MKLIELLSAEAEYSDIQITTTTAVDAGDIATHNDLIGFYPVDIAATTRGSLVWKARRVRCEKPTDEAWTPGEYLYYDSGEGNITTESSGNTVIGYVYEAAETADATGLAVWNGELAAIFAAIDAVT
ncbi:MAG: DUF2190 family protein [Desulfobacteraceae bacterium]|jgi:predicted RecA/RadA family phage recombinase